MQWERGNRKREREGGERDQITGQPKSLLFCGQELELGGKEGGWEGGDKYKKGANWASWRERERWEVEQAAILVGSSKKKVESAAENFCAAIAHLRLPTGSIPGVTKHKKLTHLRLPPGIDSPDCREYTTCLSDDALIWLTG